ncbi:sensor histidine kinase [Luteimonas granuli]|uniref:Signlal transduction histidine kinase, LytS n=1 Tax=Luteimonas granuli TaxID=1176533 RepID=A0A518N5S2_9GAMM|nr:histidine kinase [Luteimonas granuli]QDW67265.1 signlal transduction histidine kinase, LytS [Luteimonas granuli]
MDKRTSRVASAVTLLWLAYGLMLWAEFLIIQARQGFGGGSQSAFGMAMVSAAMWIPLTLVLLWVVERFPIERDRVLRSLAVLTAAVVAVIVLRGLGVLWLNPWVGWYAETPSLGSLLRVSLANKNFLVSWLLIGAAHAWLYARRAAQRERQSRKLQVMVVQARLDALSAQLNPHFLFNALNSIAEMVHRDAESADRMLVALGELLRASLEHRDTQWVTVREELGLLRDYLDIERYRLGDRLQVEWNVDPRAEVVPVPPLLLQPLAENAILHALSLRTVRGVLAIDVRLDGEELSVGISDDGGQRPSAPRHGRGLGNLRERLKYAYGRADLLRLAPNARGGMTAHLRLPVSIPCPHVAMADAA